MRRLDPIRLAAIKRGVRCPDCASTVHVDDSTDPPGTSVFHQDGCPRLAAFARTGRPSALGLAQCNAPADLTEPTWTNRKPQQP